MCMVSQFQLSKINLITIWVITRVSKKFSLRNLSYIPNTSYCSLMKREFRTHAQHPARVAYGKDSDTKLKLRFLQRVVWALAIGGLSSLEKFGKCNLCNSYCKLFKQIPVYINCIF